MGIMHMLFIFGLMSRVMLFYVARAVLLSSSFWGPNGTIMLGICIRLFAFTMQNKQTNRQFHLDT